MFVGQGEMGQDIFSGLAMLVAEELNTPLEEVAVVAAPVSPAFGNSFFPGSPQMTAASSSIKVFYIPYRNAGALRPRPVQPRNLQQGVFRGGSEPETLYRRITQGIAGTPMPAVAVVEEPNGVGLTDNQIWDLVRYLRAAAMPEPRSADGGDESGEGKER